MSPHISVVWTNYSVFKALGPPRLLVLFRTRDAESRSEMAGKWQNRDSSTAPPHAHELPSIVWIVEQIFRIDIARLHYGPN